MTFLERLESAQQGSADDLGALLESCRTYATLLASRKIPRSLRGRVSASSLVQETYLRACGRIATFRGETEAQLMAWIRRILINCLLDQLERGEFKATRQPAAVELTHAPGREPGAAAAAAEFDAAARAAIEALPTHYRLAVELRHFERLSFGDLGLILGCTEEAARKIWARAQVKLGQALRSFQ